MKKTNALASALRGAGAKVMQQEPTPPPPPRPAPAVVVEAAAPIPKVRKTQPGREGTKPITLHLNEETRRQLKALAAEEGRTVESMGAEAFNLLFARYRKPEVAIAKGPRSS
jgi:hypothetical protein